MKCFPFLTCGAFLLLQLLLMGAWPEHRVAPHCWHLLDSHWKQKEPWLPAQHPILGAGTRVSWPPSKTLSPGLASRCQHISPQSYSLAAPLRVILALSQRDLTLCGARIRPLGRGPSCGASPGWRGAISGARSGCNSPPIEQLQGLAGAQHSAGGTQGSGTRCPPAPIPVTVPGHALAVARTARAALFHFLPLSLRIVSHSVPGDYLSCNPDPCSLLCSILAGLMGCSVLSSEPCSSSRPWGTLIAALSRFLPSFIKKERGKKKKSPEANPSCLFLKPNPTSSMLSNCFPPALSLRPLGPL